jgi:hypothetical protein
VIQSELRLELRSVGQLELLKVFLSDSAWAHR